jgi:chemotaxis-related protein WspB
MQALAFRAADMRFALALTHVVQVLHDCRARPVALAPVAVTGLIHYAGELIPVVDLGLLLGSAPAAMRGSTRLIVIRIAHPTARMFAVRAEEVLDLIKIGSKVRGLDQTENRWLGEHILDDAHAAQLINPEALLPDELRALYFAHALSKPSLLANPELANPESIDSNSELAKPC